MVKAFALTGRGDSTMRKPQGVASLALGWVLHWAFSPHLLNLCGIFYACDRETVVGAMHNLIANCGVNVFASAG